MALAATVALVYSPALAKTKRLQPPPNVNLRQDRGMTFTRFPKIEQDQRVFKPINQATRLPGIDPKIEPYNLPLGSDTYHPHTGVVRGGLVDANRDVRRSQDALRRRRQEQRRALGKPARALAEAGSPSPGR